jgi:hypothetical protein
MVHSVKSFADLELGHVCPMVLSVINVQVTRVIIISAVRPSCIINIKKDKQGFSLTLLD